MRRLGSVATFHKGLGLPKSEIEADGPNKCIHYGELFTNYTEVISHVYSKTRLNEGVFSEADDILMPTSDVTPNGLVKSCCIKDDGVLLGGDIVIIRANKNLIYGEFLSRYIRTKESQILKSVTGSTVFHLYSTSINGLHIVFPSLPEQQNIGTYFRRLDELIALQRVQLEKLKQIKAAMLAGMFV